MGFCKQIDEDAIELKALDRLPDGPVKRHLDACSFCTERVNRQRLLIEYLRRLLREGGQMQASQNAPGQHSGLNETS